MKAWRVEHCVTGLGPYQTFLFDFGKWTTRSHNDNNIHPEPYSERLIVTGKVCGFKTRKQLHQWFSKAELKRLNRLGFRIRRYEAIDAELGVKQMVFVKGKRLK